MIVYFLVIAAKVVLLFADEGHSILAETSAHLLTLSFFLAFSFRFHLFSAIREPRSSSP